MKRYFVSYAILQGKMFTGLGNAVYLTNYSEINIFDLIQVTTEDMQKQENNPELTINVLSINYLDGEVDHDKKT